VTLILLLPALLFGGVHVISGEGNEGGFALSATREGVCLAGRRDSGNGYDILVGTYRKGMWSFLTADSGGDDHSYTVVHSGSGCLVGGITLARGNMDIILLLTDSDRVLKTLSLGGEGDDMLWFLRKVEGGYLLAGGVRERDWDILIVKLSDDLELLWHLRLGTPAQEYAYGAVEANGSYHVVGRSDLRGSWDGFFLRVSPEGKLLSAELVGTDGKDHLRYVDVYGGRVLAVGRSEGDDGSDLLLVFHRGESYLYDSGGFDYGRAFTPTGGGLLVVGDSSGDGFLLLLDSDMRPLRGSLVGGEGYDSVRYTDRGGWFVGYSYSLSMDNDIILGRYGEECPPLFRETVFRRRSAELERHPYPLGIRAYSLKPLSIPLKVRGFTPRRINPCQE